MGHGGGGHLAFQVTADCARNAGGFGQLGDLLRGPNAAVFAGVKTEHIGCLVPDHLEGVERREDAFVGHDEDGTAPPDLGHADVIVPVRRLLEEGDIEIGKARRCPDCLLDCVAAVGIDREPDIRPNGLAHGPKTIDIETRMCMPRHLDLDRPPATLDHPAGALGRDFRLDRADHELEADAFAG